MRTLLPALALGVASFAASIATSAADAPQPQPAAPGGIVAAAKARAVPAATVVASPVVMETTAVLQPDGRVGVACEQKRNAHPVGIGIKRPLPEPQQ